MKRIIIPAGTVSGKKDYILEIPVDSYDDENAIYILDDKSSKESVKSLSDYFYNKDSRSQLSSQYPKQHFNDADPQLYQNHSSDNERATYPSNYMLKQEYNTGNYYQDPMSIPSDISQAEKYYYYKSLGFTESELHKLLAKGGQRSMAEAPVQRKQMRFNKMGVSEFSSLYENPATDFYQYEYESFPKPVYGATGNTYSRAYNGMISSASYSNTPCDTSTSFERNNEYYEDYVSLKQLETPSNNTRMYKQYGVPPRTSIPTIRNNALRTKQSFTLPQNPSANSVGNKQVQESHYQQRYYTKSESKPKVANPSKITIKKSSEQNQSSANEGMVKKESKYEKNTANISPDASISSNTQVEDQQKLYYPRQIGHPQKRTYRTIPGTSLVSNVQSIRIRNPVSS